MLGPDQIRQELQDRNLRRVAERCGLHYNAVRRIAVGEVTNPSWETVVKLNEYLRPAE